MKTWHNHRNQTRDLMHTERLIIPLHHKRLCYSTLLCGICLSLLEFQLHVPGRLVLDVLRWPRCVPCAGRLLTSLASLRASTVTGKWATFALFAAELAPSNLMAPDMAED